MASTVLSDQELRRIRFHLGYSLSTTLFYIPADAGQVEAACNSLRPGGEAEVREVLGLLETTHQQLSAAQRRMSVAQVGDVKLRDNEAGMLAEAYDRWRLRLASALNIPVHREGPGASGGVMGRRVI